MHTKQQIQSLLASAGLNPNQRRGQNFLIDLNLMNVLLNLAQIRSNDTVLEVGCGTGSLTGGLAERAGAVISVEIESALAQIAEAQLKDKTNVQLIITDVLASKNTIDSQVIESLQAAQREHFGRIMLVANLPYSVACPVMMNLVSGPVVADCMYVTVQKEVAERMTAGPGNKHYGTISIMLAATGEVKLERTLRPSVFWPVPQVDSAMVSYVGKLPKQQKIRDIRLLGAVVSLFMGHRRKMLKACAKLAEGQLASIHNWARIFEDCSIDSQQRPEQLSADSYVAIANICAEQLKRA